VAGLVEGAARRDHDTRKENITPARPGLFTIAATSLIAVPSALHAVAPWRVACEFLGGIVLRSLYLQKKKKKKRISESAQVGAPAALFHVAPPETHAGRLGGIVAGA
jgi:hypothetical protein